EVDRRPTSNRVWHGVAKERRQCRAVITAGRIRPEGHDRWIDAWQNSAARDRVREEAATIQEVELRDALRGADQHMPLEDLDLLAIQGESSRLRRAQDRLATILLEV